MAMFLQVSIYFIDSGVITLKTFHQLEDILNQKNIIPMM